MSANIQFLIIDPQIDFCDPSGSLFVPGGMEDINRLSAMIVRLKNKISKIHVTLDSHHNIDIAHPVWFKNSNGEHPAPFTGITSSDLKNKIWETTLETTHKRTERYLKALESEGRHQHVIWPKHCLKGSYGASIMPQLEKFLQEFSIKPDLVNYITKGTNPWTEHFSAIKAEVSDPEDITTQVNVKLIKTLEEADVILIGGEASSHCLANTCMDLVKYSKDPKFVNKLHLLKDATSPVPGFEYLYSNFIDKLVKKGMKVVETTSLMKLF